MPEKIFSNILDGTFHEISFLKKYGSLYSLLKNLVTRKTTVNSGNIDKIFFIINVMHGYNDSNFDNKTKTDLESGRFQSIVLARANDAFLDTKKIQKEKRKKKKSFSATKLTKY